MMYFCRETKCSNNENEKYSENIGFQRIVFESAGRAPGTGCAYAGIWCRNLYRIARVGLLFVHIRVYSVQK